MTWARRGRDSGQANLQKMARTGTWAGRGPDSGQQEAVTWAVKTPETCSGTISIEGKAITSGKSTGRGRGLRRERAPGRGRGLRRGRGHSEGWTQGPGRRSQRGDFAPGVLERMVGLSGLDRPFPPINFTTTLEPCFTPISTINQGGRGGDRRFLLIRCRGPATRLAVKPAFWLEHPSVNHLSRSSYGETPPMGRGVRPPGAGPEMRPRQPALFDTRP